MTANIALFQVKLIDFGSVIPLPQLANSAGSRTLYEHTHKILGTAKYSAPEVICRTPYVPEKLDVWSLGVTLFEMLTGSRPFSSVDALVSGGIEYETDSLVNVEGIVKMWLILDGCMDPQPLSRVTIGDLANPESIEPFTHWMVDLPSSELERWRQSVSSWV